MENPFHRDHQHVVISLNPDQMEHLIMAVSAAAQALITQMGLDATTIANAIANPSGGVQDSTDVSAIAAAYAPISADIAKLASGATPPATVLAFNPDTSLPTPTAGVPYDYSLATTGGTGAVTFSLASGALPADFSVQASPDAVVCASPVGSSPPATYEFTLQATDSSTPPQTATLATSWSF